MSRSAPASSSIAAPQALFALHEPRAQSLGDPPLTVDQGRKNIGEWPAPGVDGHLFWRQERHCMSKLGTYWLWIRDVVMNVPVDARNPGRFGPRR